MKVIVCGSMRKEVEIDDKFKTLVTDFDECLADELCDIVLQDENVLDVDGVYIETNEYRYPLIEY